MRAPLAAALLLLAGCRSAYYGTMEAFGLHKREILVDRVEEARDQQEQAKERFQTTLERFQELSGHRGGELEELYDKLSDEYDDCDAQAKRVKGKIDAVEDVSDALFEEWEDELSEYTDPDLKKQSEERLMKTKSRCRELVSVMRKAEKSMAPVLSTLKDRVLFLKHNLNAQAVASLEGHAATLELDVRNLVRQMEAAIREANEFIDDLPEA